MRTTHSKSLILDSKSCSYFIFSLHFDGLGKWEYRQVYHEAPLNYQSQQQSILEFHCLVVRLQGSFVLCPQIWHSTIDMPWCGLRVYGLLHLLTSLRWASKKWENRPFYCWSSAWLRVLTINYSWVPLSCCQLVRIICIVSSNLAFDYRPVMMWSKSIWPLSKVSCRHIRSNVPDRRGDKWGSLYWVKWAVQSIVISWY